MTDLNLRAARIQLYGLIAAVALAIIIAIGITTGAFVLSFAVLRDLAHQAGMPVDLSWIFPAIVDGAILGATIAAVVLSKINGSAKGKTFFIWLLVSVVCISVAGNAYHAYKAAQEAARNIAAGVDVGTTPLAPTGAALIAVIPPLLVLAFTHGIGILIKAIGNAYSEYNALVNQATAIDNATMEPLAQPAPPAAANVAPAVASPIAVAPVTDQGIAPDLATPEPEVEPQLSVPTVDAPTVVLEPVAVADAVAPVADDIAAVAPAIADVAPVDVALFEVIAPPAAADATTAAEPATAAAEDSPAPTVEDLLAFIDQCSNLTENVRETARLKISHPTMSFAAIAAKTGTPHASTALRRYQRAESEALAAGFTVPPLPDLDDPNTTTDVEAEDAHTPTRELVNH